MCSFVNITACDARNFTFKPSEVKLWKYPMVRTIKGKIINGLFASRVPIPLVNPQYMVLEVLLHSFGSFL